MSVCFFVPAHIVEHLARNARRLGLDADAARRTALASHALRRTRQATATGLEALTPARPGEGDRQIFDDDHRWTTGVKQVRGEDDIPAPTTAAGAAFDALGVTRAFLREVLGRDSIDDAGMPLLADVNYGVKYGNAFWDGTRTVFGNGDDTVFRDFTADVGVCGHEVAHGLTQHTAGLDYTGQPGALNEAFSDIVAACVEQFAHRTDAGEHHWLIGEGVLADQWRGEAIRSMARPGAAYDNPVLGRDPQGAHMSAYVPGGAPHVNSGIVNRVFHLCATTLGSFPAVRIFYAALCDLWPRARFLDFAYVVSEQARLLARDGRVPRGAPHTVRSAFREVGIH
ncbi:M4 family metallopeptidase [Actinoplanes sp. NBRC 101535]|uniref:M4 family metallopeptidase n=1 Tax=Actinoplanes sp. NBRC 101535 TaxID=3032196 RepID=UPI0024A2B619|nr:M4 family metallopeptidase [Actinoplanes sp. NBRC 101535]GLY04170.1 peptidase M4 family protein [Actinoplanes sp. NBRC 101535]